MPKPTLKNRSFSRESLPTKPCWQASLQAAIRDPKTLLQACQLSNQLESLIDFNAPFRLKVPLEYVQKIEPGNPNDPLLRQVLPLSEENALLPGFTQDPLIESAHNPEKGLIHKYHGRVLLTLTGACAIHCRYCFRRHFPYADNQPNPFRFERILAYLKTHPEISEIILSGGDPFALSDNRLKAYYEQLANLPSIKRIRIHSRLIGLLPHRLTPALQALLASPRFKHIVVFHINHPNEIDDALRQTTQLLQGQGVTLLNQSVLLKGVNDDAKTLIALQERLFEAHILPYYLHLLDKVQGSAHFEVKPNEAKALLFQLMSNLPGYLVPRLVKEDPFAKSKTPLSLLY